MVKTATKVLCAIGLAALLLAPTVLAFFSGGYFDQPRLVAGIAAWAVVIVAAIVSPWPLPGRWPGRAALGGLALLAAVVGLSITWAPLKGPALADFERVLMYLGVAVAATAFLAWRPLARFVEPVLALGALVVIGYGLSDRLLPGVVHQKHSASAGGRLEQPLTYWNAMGALAALGFVLCARLAGDTRRPAWMRAAAAAAAAPLAAGIWLSYSRGAILATAVAIVVLALVALSRPQLIAIAIAGLVGVVSAVAAELLHGVRSLEGSLSSREGDGLVMLAVLALAMAAAAVVQLFLARQERRGRITAAPIRLPRWVRPVVGVSIAVLLVAAVAITASKERPRVAQSPAFGATSQRFQSFESNRYAYWKVAAGMFADHPLKGDGSHSFAVDWIQKRKIVDPAKDAHSLYIETAAELGLLGLLALGLFLGGAGVAAARARRLDPALAAGPIAALTVWLVHAGLDWDWEMPAVSLIALLLIAALVAASEQTAVELSSSPGSPEARPPIDPPPPAVPAGAPAGA